MSIDEPTDWERELLESTPPTDPDAEYQCSGCWKLQPTRRWPFDQQPRLCEQCWLLKVRGKVEAELLCGELVVFSNHPQRGCVLRGAIRGVGIEPRDLQPVIRWRMTGPRPDHDLGIHVGDFVDAQARLLNAIPTADQLDPTTITKRGSDRDV